MFQKMLQGGSGTQQKHFHIINQDITSNRIECGFRPKTIIIESYNYNNTTQAALIYDEETRPGKQAIHYNNAENIYDIGKSHIMSIDDNGFNLNVAYVNWKNANIIVLG